MSGLSDIAEYIDNEWYVVRHSGELPEVALHAALHFLTESHEGPRLSLGEHQLRTLQKAAMERYREIILRDLRPENRDLPLYRGITRSIINYHRYQRFCRRQGLEVPTAFTREVAAALGCFLAVEVADVRQEKRQSVINCSYHELYGFAMDLGLAPETLPPELASLLSAAAV